MLLLCQFVALGLVCSLLNCFSLPLFCAWVHTTTKNMRDAVWHTQMSKWNTFHLCQLPFTHITFCPKWCNYNRSALSGFSHMVLICFHMRLKWALVIGSHRSTRVRFYPPKTTFYFKLEMKLSAKPYLAARQKDTRSVLSVWFFSQLYLTGEPQINSYNGNEKSSRTWKITLSFRRSKLKSESLKLKEAEQR